MKQSDFSGLNGADFYDDEEVFRTYLRARMRPNSPNETLEKPIIWELLGNISGASILDLGCGDGAFGMDLLQAGCRSYTGLEASKRMLALAEKNLNLPYAQVTWGDIGTWMYPPAAYDVVLSRLALHYIDELAGVLKNVHQALLPGGRFIFSVEHPVITSCNRSRGESGDGQRQDWIVDDYFSSGRREVMWMGQRVVKYHRTVEDYFSLLQQANFTVTHLRESRPMPDLFENESLFERRSRIPLFLFFAAEHGPA